MWQRAGGSHQRLFGPVRRYSEKDHPENIWQAVAVNGKNYSVPVYYRDFAASSSRSPSPKHLFEKYNLSTDPKDSYELIDSFATILENENDPDASLVGKSQQFNQLYAFASFGQLAFYRSR